MDLSYTELFSKIKDLEEKILTDIENGIVKIIDIPEVFVTQSMALNSVIMEKGCIENIPFSKLDNIVCLAACQLLSQNLMNIPPERSPWVSSALKEPFLKVLSEQFKTPFICKEFVRLNHLNVNFTPQALLGDRDYLKELCLINPSILSVLPFTSCDYELCNLAMESSEFTLSCIPPDWRTKDICLAAFEKNYIEVMRFPSEFVNLQIIKTAIRLCQKDEVGIILQLLSTDHFDNDLIITAIQKNESAFSMVPFEKINVDLVFNIAPFIKKHETLHHIPENIFNINIAHRLITCNAMLLYGIPRLFRNKKLCLEAITSNGMALGAVPNNFKSDELFRVAVMNNGLALEYIPTPYRDNEIPILAVEQNGEAIEFVPEMLIDEVLCRKAVIQNPHAIYSIPKKLLSNELYMMAIKELPDVLKLIPTDSRTLDQCLMALEGSSSLYDYIPMQLRDNPRIVRLAIRLGLVKSNDPIGIV
jgi:hypothetical protein